MGSEMCIRDSTYSALVWAYSDSSSPRYAEILMSTRKCAEHFTDRLNVWIEVHIDWQKKNLQSIKNVGGEWLKTLEHISSSADLQTLLLYLTSSIALNELDGVLQFDEISGGPERVDMELTALFKLAESSQ